MKTTNLLQTMVELPHRMDVLIFVTDLKDVYLLDFVEHEYKNVYLYLQMKITKQDMEVFNKLPITKFKHATDGVVEFVELFCK